MLKRDNPDLNVYYILTNRIRTENFSDDQGPMLDMDSAESRCMGDYDD